MNSTTLLGDLLWFPSRIGAPEPFVRPSKRLVAGLALGMAGMGLQVAYDFPPSGVISVNGSATLALVVNKTAGFGAGIIFILLLWLLESGVLACFGARKTGPAIAGSFSVFAFLPLLAMPIHALFQPHLGQAGPAWIIWALVAGFLAWHATWLVLFLHGGHVDRSERGPMSIHALVRLWSIVFGIELVGGILFLSALPLAFNSNITEFFYGWF